jgi:hypothetical protein
VLNKRFGITFKELSKTMKYYCGNNISMEEWEWIEKREET